MIKTIRLLLCSIILSLACDSWLRGAETPATAAGYWEGTITMPNRELSIHVELARGGSGWQGTIDIPLQGLRGFKLDPIKVEGNAVEFSLPGIPGDPQFAGKLSADARAIAGYYTQGSGSTTFQLERKTKPAPKPDEATPASGVPGKGLAGNWRGSIKPLPNIELRLALELTADASGKPEGVLISLDQGSPRMPITTLTESNGTVHLEVASIGGTFTGKFNADGSELGGDWAQGGRTTPLVFKRMPVVTGVPGSTKP